jgi:hypothetical protein
MERGDGELDVQLGSAADLPGHTRSDNGYPVGIRRRRLDWHHAAARVLRRSY